jgi:hypothetical protein
MQMELICASFLSLAEAIALKANDGWAASFSPRLRILL